MQVSIQTIVSKMEQELLQLQKEAEHGSSQKVKEHAKLLKAYCELILDSEKTVNRSVNNDLPVKRHVPTNIHNEEKTDSTNNLLDF